MSSFIKENIDEVRKRIENSAKKVGRNPDDILLLAVSKTIDVPKIKEAVACGLNSLGENRVQEIMEKYEPMGDGINWHLIGHLQTNKVKYIIDKVCLIHSVESIKLATEIDKKAEKSGVIMDILVEVNMAGEESKFGIAPSECESFIRELSKFKNIRVKGLMTVAPFTENPEDNRIYFRKLKEMLVDINSKNIDNINMCELSMGMTGDYEVAIEEGATIVSVGTGIFGERFYPNKNK